MAKVINVSLSETSINKAIAELKAYKTELHRKCGLFIEKLAERGYSEAEMVLRYIPSDELEDNNFQVGIKYDLRLGRYIAKLTISGSEVAFVEFGAGQYYNTPIGDSPHPKGKELGLTIGSYEPNKGNAGKDFWFTPSGRFTRGTHCRAPAYKAWARMKADLVQVAREVFSNS